MDFCRQVGYGSFLIFLINPSPHSTVPLSTVGIMSHIVPIQIVFIMQSMLDTRMFYEDQSIVNEFHITLSTLLYKGETRLELGSFSLVMTPRTNNLF